MTEIALDFEREILPLMTERGVVEYELAKQRAINVRLSVLVEAMSPSTVTEVEPHSE